jgi:outer membrane protein, heavy metal efflux system
MKFAPLLAFLALLAFGGQPSRAAVVTNLTLAAALELAERHHPQLAEARALVEAAGGRVQQAGALPNPEAVLRAEQLPFRDTPARDRQFVVGVAQTVPLGSRLAKARRAEQLELEARTQRLEAARRDVRRRVHAAFATALYQERAFQLQSQLAEAAGRAVALVQARLAAGDAVPEELARAEIELARARMESQRSGALREQARLALAAAVSAPELRIESLAGELSAAFEVPSLETLAAHLAAHPELLHAQAAQRAGAARVELALAERIPDVSAEVLYRRLEATRQDTLDLGLRIPLPVFNSGAARVREARAEAAAAEARSRQARGELEARLAAAHTELRAALAHSRALRAEILPRAEFVLRAAETRHAAGDLGLGEVLPARRDAVAARLGHLESLRDVMRAWAELAGHLARPAEILAVRP